MDKSKIGSSAREDFVCDRCGLCCQKENLEDGRSIGKNVWVGGKLTWQQKQDLLEERKKYPPATGCRMLYFDDELAHCLVQKFIGIEAKEKNCVDYPLSEQCLREIKETLELGEK